MFYNVLKLNFIVFFVFIQTIQAQKNISLKDVVWSNNKNVFYSVKNNSILETQFLDTTHTILLDSSILEKNKINNIEDIYFSNKEESILIFYNAKRNWRYKTKGNYAVYNLKDSTFYLLGKDFENDLMNAKFSPDGKNIGYVYKNNIYVENLDTKEKLQLTNSGTANVFNGVFDWSYEEEFKCLDGFRWSFDSKNIAYWHIDASAISYFTMLNNIDSVYPKVINFPYPKVNYAVPKVKIGVLDIVTKKNYWVNTGNDSEKEYFFPRMEWFPNTNKLVIQYLNREQTKTKLYKYDLKFRKSDLFYVEEDSVWIDVKANWHKKAEEWEWISDTSFLWFNDKNEFRQFEIIDINGKISKIFNEKFDVIDLVKVDSSHQKLFFLASPKNPTQKYLYVKFLNHLLEPSQLITPLKFSGTNHYEISNFGEFAIHSFTNYFTPTIQSLIRLDSHQIIWAKANYQNFIDSCHTTFLKKKIKFFSIPYPKYQSDLNAWAIYPDSFKTNKKYPVLFYVYGEPATQVVSDAYQSQRNLYEYTKNSPEFIYIGIDNRGSPLPKGKAWRKAIYKNNGIVNVEDQVFGAKEIKKWEFIDTNKMGVWGWSGGGTMALNLLLRYPEIYKVGVSIAPVTDLKLYDNIYEERYMGLYPSNIENYIKGSPITYAKNLTGKLLLIHGTGDDNVHFQNTEILVNEFIKYNKTFDLMIYPNRSHGIYEGENTRPHLKKLFTEFLNEHLFFHQTKK